MIAATLVYSFAKLNYYSSQQIVSLFSYKKLNYCNTVHRRTSSVYSTAQ